MEYGVLECGCVVTKSHNGMRIDYCPLHKAAMDMFKVLKKVQKEIQTSGATYVSTDIVIDKVIAKAGGK